MTVTPTPYWMKFALTGWCSPPKRVSYRVPAVMQPSAASAHSRPAVERLPADERDTITSAAPARPSTRPAQRTSPTCSPAKRGASSATSIGCSETTSATVAAESSRSRAR